MRAISFTGSTSTGNRIVKEAGLKKFSMELGGKSPFVIFDDANLERALDAAIFMIFSNNGERCTAGSRILVQRSIYGDFIERFAERAASAALRLRRVSASVASTCASRPRASCWRARSSLLVARCSTRS